ncbi:TIL domain-containing protein [Caenorhabditis elegans]|uniref:TIL domain-containing protein n=1 Tax=Caenorhabditis elegans TaxID=6239 RepID=O16488_CAEEL|nr:TIL domain-containing protein [Caenorhabditis elegans]CCD61492.1 TIL domain-containing protein [Caenorhabditis elegans]|eukprot:NP_504409.1 Uncharacterized protein CELE_B0238.12 [Caenorhabditis elegans]
MKVFIVLAALIGCYVYAQDAQILPVGGQVGGGQRLPCRGRNEEYKTCGTACEPSCTNPNPMCTKQCINNVCQCRSGYVRNEITRQCVRQAQCSRPGTGFGSSTPFPSQSPQRCGRNETFRTCGSSCEPSCTTPRPQACTMQCIVNVCQCSEGFVRGPSGCVRQRDC